MVVQLVRFLFNSQTRRCSRQDFEHRNHCDIWKAWGDLSNPVWVDSFPIDLYNCHLGNKLNTDLPVPRHIQHPMLLGSQKEMLLYWRSQSRIGNCLRNFHPRSEQVTRMDKLNRSESLYESCCISLQTFQSLSGCKLEHLEHTFHLEYIYRGLHWDRFGAKLD